MKIVEVEFIEVEVEHRYSFANVSLTGSMFADTGAPGDVPAEGAAILVGGL